MKVSDDLSNKMANMSFVCSILVVALHTISSYPGVRFVVAIGVPYFFIASGFFLAAHVDEQGWYKQAIQKRIKTLVVPFFIWFFIGVIVYTPMNIIADVLAHRPFGSSISFLHTSLLGKFGLQFNEFPIGLGALWYVRGLFMLVLASPLLVWCIRKMKCAFPIIALLAWLVYRYFLASTPMDKSIVMGLLGVGFSMMGFCYFTFGIYLRLHPINLAHNWGGGELVAWNCLVASRVSHLAVCAVYNCRPIGITVRSLWDLDDHAIVKMARLVDVSFVSHLSVARPFHALSFAVASVLEFVSNVGSRPCVCTNGRTLLCICAGLAKIRAAPRGCVVRRSVK